MARLRIRLFSVFQTCYLAAETVGSHSSWCIGASISVIRGSVEIALSRAAVFRHTHHEFFLFVFRAKVTAVFHTITVGIRLTAMFINGIRSGVRLHPLRIDCRSISETCRELFQLRSARAPIAGVRNAIMISIRFERERTCGKHSSEQHYP